ncbi:BadF/BadG/BcrA/BcrD ATPase family protein [Mycobacterium sp. NPDC051198]
MSAGVYVGVDSGGTRTNVEIVFETDDGQVRRATYESGDSLSGALEHSLIPKVLGRVLAPLSMHIDELANEEVPTYVWISAAGYTPWTRDEFNTAILEVGPAVQGVVAIGAANDAVSLLLGSGADGIVIAGTGSSVIVRPSDGAMYQAGGHEWVACDYGSGFWIGLDAIRRAFRDYEAGTESVLLQRLREAYGIRSNDHRALISKMRDLAIADSNMKGEIARFTASVCGAAERGDLSSQNLVKAAAEDLADVASVAVRRRFTADELSDGIRLVECGSLLNNVFYRSAFESQIEMRLRSGFERQVVITWDRALTGSESCVNMARRLTAPHLDIMRLPVEFRPSIIQF